MTDDKPVTISSPSVIGGHRITNVLVPDHTFAARTSSGRDVVLKILDNSCLLDGELHPNVRERLAHVRELAEKGVANLHGVERDGGLIYLVWDYVPGVTFASAGVSELPHRELILMARELVLLVESLHASGIVHGAIKSGNVIVDSSRRMRLTHVSPLLYNDPRYDVRGVIELLSSIVEARRETELPLGRALASTGIEHGSLRQLGAQLASLGDARESIAPSPVHDAKQEAHQRRRALLMAGLVACAGFGVFGAVWWAERDRSRELVPMESNHSSIDVATTRPVVGVKPGE